MSALPPPSQLRAWSRARAEPPWLAARRLEALERAAALGGVGELLEEAPLRAPLGPPELCAQGVALSTLRAAVASAPGAVEPALPPLPADADAEELAHEALWTDGWFVCVPDGVEAAVPLQLGSDLSRSSRERTLVAVGARAALSLVEGCAGGPVGAARRMSVLDAAVGAGGALTAASVQSWPAGVDYRSLKRVAAASGARVVWRDASLGGSSTDKRVRVRLAGAAAARVEIAGFAAAGQRQRLEAFASGAGSARLSSRCARRGGFVRSYLLAAAATPVEREETFLDLEAVGEEERLYLATRGLEGRAAEAAALHAFFAPFAASLPLEFSVELTRLLDAELIS